MNASSMFAASSGQTMLPLWLRQVLAPLFASPLSRTFAFAVIATSTAITVIVTSIQLWFDYQTSLASTQSALTQVESSYSSSLSASLWTYNDELVQSQLEGITNLTEIEWAEIVTENETRWAAGEQESAYTLERVVPLIYPASSGPLRVGQLTLLSSLDAIYWILAKKFAVVLLLNLIKTLCMSVFIIYLFHRIVGRHLINLSDYLKVLKPNEQTEDFRLRERQKGASTDELDLLVASINDMRANVMASFDTIRQYRDDLEEALQAERELSGLQRQFVSMVSHEFRTPLAIIDGNAQRLQRSKAEISAEKLSVTLTKIRTSVSRMTELLESVLNSSRLEDGKIDYNPADCNIAALIQDICGSYRELATGHRIVEHIDNLPETIIADEKLLRHVVSNLMSNATKYAPEGTSIWLRAYVGDQNDVVIAVQDQGVGIPEDEIDELFRRFFRASTSTGIPGTGIGLHLVKSLIDLHGGQIEVESRPDQGSTFTVHLPINQSAMEQAP